MIPETCTDIRSINIVTSVNKLVMTEIVPGDLNISSY